MNKKITKPKHKLGHYLKWIGIATVITIIATLLSYKVIITSNLLPLGDRIERPKILALSRKVYTQQCRKAAGHPDNVCSNAEYTVYHLDSIWSINVSSKDNLYNASVDIDSSYNDPELVRYSFTTNNGLDWQRADGNDIFMIIEDLEN